VDPSRGWHAFSPSPQRSNDPLWVNDLSYGVPSGGLWLDASSGMVWTDDRGWHWYNPYPIEFEFGTVVFRRSDVQCSHGAESLRANEPVFAIFTLTRSPQQSLQAVAYFKSRAVRQVVLRRARHAGGTFHYIGAPIALPATPGTVQLDIFVDVHWFDSVTVVVE
jgi:hypothetical protein